MLVSSCLVRVRWFSRSSILCSAHSSCSCSSAILLQLMLLSLQLLTMLHTHSYTDNTQTGITWRTHLHLELHTNTVHGSVLYMHYMCTCSSLRRWWCSCFALFSSCSRVVIFSCSLSSKLFFYQVSYIHIVMTNAKYHNACTQIHIVHKHITYPTTLKHTCTHVHTLKHTHTHKHLGYAILQPWHLLLQFLDLALSSSTLLG